MSPKEHHPGGHLLNGKHWWPRKSSLHLPTGLGSFGGTLPRDLQKCPHECTSFQMLVFKKEKIKFSKDVYRQSLYMER